MHNLLYDPLVNNANPLFELHVHCGELDSLQGRKFPLSSRGNFRDFSFVDAPGSLPLIAGMQHATRVGSLITACPWQSNLQGNPLVHLCIDASPFLHPFLGGTTQFFQFLACRIIYAGTSFKLYPFPATFCKLYAAQTSLLLGRRETAVKYSLPVSQCLSYSVFPELLLPTHMLPLLPSQGFWTA